MSRNFEEYLGSLIKPQYVVEEAMRYSLMARSKRIRPLLMLTLLKDLGISEEEAENYYPAAAAIEFVHTYSLIHDDLPAFDNDDYRRGQPSCHKAYDEQTAILAGDGLLTDAFDLIASAGFESDKKAELVSLLSRYAGSSGMIRGQALDKQFEGKSVSVDDLLKMDELKTGRLLTLPLLSALILAGRKEETEKFSIIGRNIGIAFQIQDDLLDILSTAEQLGKSTSDVENDKNTYVSLLGIEEAGKMVAQLFSESYELLGDDYPSLRQMLKRIEKRTW
ncbi:MAG: polyprenyl synthetase family protein [Erysipelotrichaceae bacterium]|nr:polyprenyl synthetase family protein [Erysipelotrichaceae bacterium]